MPEVSRSRASYRTDRAVPAFDDSRALFVFDGVCVRLVDAFFDASAKATDLSERAKSYREAETAPRS